MTDNIASKLERLANLRAMKDASRLAYDDMRKAVIPAELQAQLDDIDAEQRTAEGAIIEAIDALTSEIKKDVVLAGETIKGGGLMAKYSKGRESWDGKALGGYSAAHPEILAFRKVGEPSVSIQAMDK